MKNEERLPGRLVGQTKVKKTSASRNREWMVSVYPAAAEGVGRPKQNIQVVKEWLANISKLRLIAAPPRSLRISVTLGPPGAGESAKDDGQVPFIRRNLAEN